MGSTIRFWRYKLASWAMAHLFFHGNPLYRLWAKFVLQPASDWEVHEMVDANGVYEFIAQFSESRNWLTIRAQYGVGQCPDPITLDWVLRVHTAYKKSRHDGREALVEALKFAGDLPEEIHGSDLWPLENWVIRGLHTTRHEVNLWLDRSIDVDKIDSHALTLLLQRANNLEGVEVCAITAQRDDGGPYAPYSLSFTTPEPDYLIGIALMVRRRDDPMRAGGWALRVCSNIRSTAVIREITTDQHRYYALAD